jgi:hypothetical protein
VLLMQLLRRLSLGVSISRSTDLALLCDDLGKAASGRPLSIECEADSGTWVRIKQSYWALFNDDLAAVRPSFNSG